MVAKQHMVKTNDHLSFILPPPWSSRNIKSSHTHTRARAHTFSAMFSCIHVTIMGRFHWWRISASHKNTHAHTHTSFTLCILCKPYSRADNQSVRNEACDVLPEEYSQWGDDELPELQSVTCEKRPLTAASFILFLLTNSICVIHSENEKLLKAVIVAGLYPKVAKIRPSPHKKRPM